MFKHLKYILTFPKIGPDMYLTHWLLYFKPFRLWFQAKKLHTIGRNSEVRPFATILGTDNVRIGNNVIIPPGTLLSTHPSKKEYLIIIEDDVLFGPNVAVYCSTHNFTDTTKPIKDQGYKAATTTLKKGCWLGINSVILPGITVGKNSIVGANSVVTKDVPDLSLIHI